MCRCHYHSLCKGRLWSPMGWITTAGLLLEAILLPSRNGGTLVPAVLAREGAGCGSVGDVPGWHLRMLSFLPCSSLSLAWGADTLRESPLTVRTPPRPSQTSSGPPAALFTGAVQRPRDPRSVRLRMEVGKPGAKKIPVMQNSAPPPTICVAVCTPPAPEPSAKRPGS